MKSFEEIYKQHYEYVYKYLRGLTADEHLAEDLASETFLRAMIRKNLSIRGEEHENKL